MSPLLRLAARLIGLCPAVLAGWLLASVCLAEAPTRATPKVLAIDEAHAAVARVQVRSYIFDMSGDKPRVYYLKGAQPDLPPQPGKKAKPDTDPDEDEKKGDAGRSGDSSPGALSGLPGGLHTDGARNTQEYEVVPVHLDQLNRLRGGKLAEQVRPVRMAIIAGSFPYRKQLDEFRRKLRLRTHAAVLAERVSAPERKGEKRPAFRFLGVEAQRQTLTADGRKVLRDWEKIDLRNTYRPFIFLTGKRFEPGKEKYRPVLIPGLVMPRLLTFRGASEGPPYPDVAGKVKNVARALTKVKPLPPEPNEFDPFNPQAPVKLPPAKPVLPAPEHCLVRVIDVTIQPGLAYRYRLRVRMANPNYHRKDVKKPRAARDPVLKPGPWFVLKQLVRLSPELHYYAVDQHFLDQSRTRVPFLRTNQTVLQMHRWLDTVKIPGETRPLMVGEWVVAERVPVYRGEYVGKSVPIKFPVWRPTRDAFVIAGEVEKKRGRRAPEGIPVDFGLRRKDGLETLLVDFEEGFAATEYGTDRVREDFATEVLLLTPEGKLLARNSARDGRDRERIRRLELVRQRLALLRRR
jgi:hypothetical protein